MSVNINDQNDQIYTTSGTLRQGDVGGFIVASGDNGVNKPPALGNNGLIRYNTSGTGFLEAVINGVYHTFAFTDTITGFVNRSGDTMTGALGIVSGTNSAPGLFVSGSTLSGTGLFSPGGGGTNQLSVTTNGTEAVRFDNVQNSFFFGTLSVTPTSTDATINVQGNNLSPAAVSLKSTNSLGGWVGTTNAKSFSLYTNNTSQMTIDQLGNVTVQGPISLVSGGTSTTPSPGDSSSKIATTQFVTSAIRQRLSSNTTYYVSTTGLDSNAGTSISPWLTIQHAINVIADTIDINGNTVTIQLLDGIHTTASIFGIVISQAWIGGGVSNVIINGNAGTPANTIIETTAATGICCLAQGQSGITVQNVKLQAVSNGVCLWAAAQGQIITGPGVIFGAAGSGHILADRGGLILVTANYTINGSSGSHISAIEGEVFLQNGVVGTVIGTPTFSTFAVAGQLGSISVAGASFSGSATGTRYSVAINGTIYTGGGGPNFFPGSSPGSAVTGGQYV